MSESHDPQQPSLDNNAVPARRASLARRHPVLAIGLLLVMAYGAWWIVLQLNRPMFCNEMADRRRTLLLQMWLPPSLEGDEYGNCALADDRLNILVVFLVGSDSSEPSRLDPVRFLCPHPVADGVNFPDERGRDTLDFHVPRRENTLFVFEADGSRRDFALAAGEAKRIYEFLVAPDGSFREMLPEAYAEKHSTRLTGIGCEDDADE